jgi:hypothetical protein
MPFVLLLFGIILILVGYQGTQGQFFSLLKGDFTGSGNFIYWIISIGVVGSIGYIPKFKGISNAFMALIIIVLFVSHKGFFAQFSQAFGINTTKATNTGTPLSDGIGSVGPG